MTHPPDVVLKARIIRLSTIRSEHWRHGDTQSARHLSRELEQLWELYRIARAAALQEQPAPVSDHPVDRFIDQACESHHDASATVAAVNAAYDKWAEANDEDAITAKRLNRELADRGIHSHRGAHGARYFAGIRVTHPVHMPDRDSESVA